MMRRIDVVLLAAICCTLAGCQSPTAGGQNQPDNPSGESDRSSSPGPGTETSNRGEEEHADQDELTTRTDRDEPDERPDPVDEPEYAEPASPGIDHPSPVLIAELQRALDDRGEFYSPRTHHLEPDGAPTYTNRLIRESSPYLLQHAHNPVNWYPWGDEAFARARELGRPVILSVGYSTCHWCHVMEVESFEDLEIAEYMNRNFIAIKVDREERPDVDDVYMTATRLLTRRGGWPMTVVMTPDGEPFFAGTYFPARAGDRRSRRGFFEIIQELSDSYQTDPASALETAADVSQRLRDAARARPPGGVPTAAAMASAAQRITSNYDATWGGFGNAPKFPRSVVLEFLFREQRRVSDSAITAMVTHTLDAMAAGGMYDQIGGGFHRYSTDARWLVPHFEKMLYDNAQLAVAYLEGFQITGQQAYADIATEILDYVALEMTHPRGGFYSATDADNVNPEGHMEEGAFFTWTPDEVRAVVGLARALVVNTYFDIEQGGNFDGRSIPNRPRSDEDVAQDLGMTVEELLGEIEAARPQLYEARAERNPPLRDDKILTSWNGLMISAFARVGFVLERPDFINRAVEAADFITQTLIDDQGRLIRSWTDGIFGPMGYVDDYAFFSQGLLDLYEATGDVRWLNQALNLQTTLDRFYWDDENGGYFMTARDAEALLTRSRPDYDGAEPSGNSVALMNLLRLQEFGQIDSFRVRAEQGFQAFSRTISRAGTSVPKMLTALDFYLDSTLEIVIVAPESGGDSAPLLDVLRTTFVPNRVIIRTREGTELDALATVCPLVENKRAIAGQVTVYVCEAGECELPTSDPDVFRSQLTAARR